MRSNNMVGKRTAGASRQLKRLLRDERGNTIAIIAAAVFPMLAVIGGGLDLARAHVVKSRLNEACDAAALAGRRSMSNEDLTTATPEANKFFNHNFKQGYLGATTFVPSITKPDVGVIQVAASTLVPTTLMKIFGYTTIPVSVTCNATQNFDNIDIVLVLDTTGSMAYNMNNSSQVGDASSSSKMYGLRQAVMALYDELKPAQDQLAAQGLRLRYGIVPYSSSVNVGNNIRAANPSYMLSTTHSYQSRARVSGNWQYKPVSYDISSYVAGGTLNTPTGSSGANQAMTWGGCIEERNTVSTITSSTSTASVPTGAYDLDVDLIPTSDATRWKPYMASAASVYDSPVYNRNAIDDGYKPSFACPRAARNLATMTRAEMVTYTNSLFSDGNTYHDIGMNWGNRFISSGGIFGPNNPTTLGNRPVRKFIIFMTDGMMDTTTTEYTAYGLEKLDKRVTGGFTSDANQVSRHKQRFLIACNEAKKRGVSVWSIVFATTTESTLSACASNADQYALSTNSAALIAKFKEIGKNIGTLRLSQ